jgi:hypothetical protein
MTYVKYICIQNKNTRQGNPSVSKLYNCRKEKWRGKENISASWIYFCRFLLKGLWWRRFNSVLPPSQIAGRLTFILHPAKSPLWFLLSQTVSSLTKFIMKSMNVYNTKNIYAMKIYFTMSLIKLIRHQQLIFFYINLVKHKTVWLRTRPKRLFVERRE